jgi:hypothetical protein
MVDAELEDLYLADRKDRLLFKENKISEKRLNLNDAQRRTQLQLLLPHLDLSEIWNCHYAALILHHSSEPKDFKHAHRLAKKAVNMGSKVSLWLFAATLDRLLLSQGKMQKFGTQYKFDDKKKRFIIQPIDPKTTDQERAYYKVTPLKDLKK